MKRLGFKEREASLAAEQRTTLRDFGIDLQRLCVLDIGCSNLRLYSQSLLSSACRYVGVELDDQALKQASASATRPLLLVNGNAENLPFLPESFDLVVINDMLAYCDKTRVLKEAERVLRPGGRVVSLHNNSIGWSFYKLRFPEKAPLIEWGHSCLVVINTLLARWTGLRLFRTTYNTRSDLLAAIQRTGMILKRHWTTKKAYRWHHFVLEKPAPGGLR